MTEQYLGYWLTEIDGRITFKPLWLPVPTAVGWGDYAFNSMENAKHFIREHALTSYALLCGYLDSVGITYSVRKTADVIVVAEGYRFKHPTLEKL